MSPGNSKELMWRSSSFCLPTDCVEVASYRGQILIRDSAASTSRILRFPNRAWQVFIQCTAATLPPQRYRRE
jgi:Domain of unknown function (DUF397)